jgi:hypothetical protein
VTRLSWRSIFIAAQVGFALASCEPPVVDEAPIVLPPRPNPPAEPDASTGGTSGGPACAAPLTACGAACFDLKKDDQACGRCGRSCGTGSTCSDGRCAPVTLAQNLTSPSGLTLGSSFALVLIPDGVVRCGKEGCAQGATRLWTEAGWSTVKGALALSPDGMYGFFLGRAPAAAGTEERLYRVEPSGAALSSPPPITQGVTFQLNTTFALATDTREHFFGSPYRNYRCFKDSCNTIVTAWDGETPTSIALSPTHYVWTMTNDPTDAVKICARPPATDTTYATANCGTATGLAPPRALGPIGFKLGHVTVHAGVVYWAEWGDSGKNGRIFSCPLTGCSRTPKTIVGGEEIIDGLAVDASGVYWTSGASGVVRACRDLAAGCGEGETIAGGASNPGPIAVDDKFVYYVARGGVGVAGALLKVAK